MNFRLGDAASRLEEDFVVVPATPEMQQESALLSTNAAVAWLEGARSDVSTAAVTAALAAKFAIREADVSVVRHFPEQFFVRFMYQHHRANATSSGDFHQDGLHIFVRAWRLEAHANNEDQLHHVRLCIEGIPVHGWNNYVASFIIGRGCSLDYIESRSLLREDTRYLALWAWTANPDTIPKLKWLTLPARGERRRGRRGLKHRVFIHLDLHEDHSRAREDDVKSPAPVVHEFSWLSGIIDGHRRAPSAAPVREGRRNDRRDDEDDRDDCRGRGGSRGQSGLGERIRRSLYRNARERHRGTDQDRSRDRSGAGRRHDIVPLAVLLSAKEPAQERGRSPARQASSRSARRLSRENLTPPCRA